MVSYEAMERVSLPTGSAERVSFPHRPSLRPPWRREGVAAPPFGLARVESRRSPGSSCRWSCQISCGYCLNVFCFVRLPLSWSIVKREQTFLGAFRWSVSLVISVLLTSSVPSRGWMRQEENARNLLLCSCLVLTPLAYLTFYFQLPSYDCFMYNVQEFELCLGDRIGRKKYFS